MKKIEWLFCGVGIFLFFIVTYWTLCGHSVSFDTYIYECLHQLPHAFNSFFRFITKFANTKSIFVFVFIFVVMKPKYGKWVAMNVVGNVLLNNIIKFIIQRERPSLEHLVQAGGYSFPSGHAMVALSLYGLLIYFIYKKIKNPLWKYTTITLLVILIISIALSRIYLGVHYPSDIIGGLLLSSVYLFIFIIVMRKINPQL